MRNPALREILELGAALALADCSAIAGAASAQSSNAHSAAIIHLIRLFFCNMLASLLHTFYRPLVARL